MQGAQIKYNLKWENIWQITVFCNLSTVSKQSVQMPSLQKNRFSAKSFAKLLPLNEYSLDDFVSRSLIAIV